MIREVLNLDRLLAMRPNEAAALLAVRRSDGASAQDTALLNAWLEVDLANRAAWEFAISALDAFADADDDELLDAMRLAAQTARPASAPPRFRLAAAAAIMVMITGALLLMFASGEFGNRSKTIVASSTARAARIYATGTGQRGSFILADGSRLTLEADTTVKTGFTNARRDLQLTKGQAAFDVAHNASRPFVVQAGGQEVSAIGTQFNVLIDGDRVRVVLVQGSVAVRALSAVAPQTILRPGQQLDVETGKAPVISNVGIAPAAQVASGGVVTFNDLPLATAVAQFTHGSGDRIVVRDPRLAALRITGRFRTGDVQRFGRTLAEIYKVRLIQIAPHQFEIVAGP